MDGRTITRSPLLECRWRAAAAASGASRTSTITARGGGGGVQRFASRAVPAVSTRRRGSSILLMQQFLWKDQGGPPCPFGWALVPSELQALIPNAIAARLKYATCSVDTSGGCAIRHRPYTQNPAAIDAERSRMRRAPHCPCTDPCTRRWRPTRWLEGGDELNRPTRTDSIALRQSNPCPSPVSPGGLRLL